MQKARRITNSNWERPLGIVLNQPQRKTGILFGPPPKDKDTRAPLNVGEMHYVGRYDLHSFMGQGIGIELYMQFIASEVTWRLKEKSKLEAKPSKVRLQITYKAGKFLHKSPPFGEAATFSYQAIWPDLMNPNPIIRINEATKGKFKYELSDSKAFFPDVEKFSLVGEERGLPHITYWTDPSGHGGIFWDFRANKFLSTRLLRDAKMGTDREKEIALEMAWEESKGAAMGLVKNMGIKFTLERKYNEEAVKDSFRKWFFYTAGSLYEVDGRGMTPEEWVGDGSKWLPSAKKVLEWMKLELIKLNKPMLVYLDTVGEETQTIEPKLIYSEESLLSEEFLLEEKISYIKKKLVTKGLPQQQIKEVEDIIMMKFLDGNLTNKKIGEKLGMNRETVRRYLKLAQDNLPRE